MAASAGNSQEGFWQFVWRITKRPIRAIGGNPLAQSAAAFGVNIWCLVLAPLGQFWVIFSAVLLLLQTHNTWMAGSGRRGRTFALFFGLILLSLNVGALVLAVLAQFWVFASAALATWQYVNLIRICFPRTKGP